MVNSPESLTSYGQGQTAPSVIYFDRRKMLKGQLTWQVIALLIAITFLVLMIVS